MAEAEAGIEVLIRRHNKTVARLTRSGAGHLDAGSRFGKGRLRPAVKIKTAGRYLQSSCTAFLIFAAVVLLAFCNSLGGRPLLAVSRLDE